MLFDTAAYTSSNDPDSWKPMIFWDVISIAGTIEATTETDEHPATTLAQSNTDEYWEATGTSDGYLTNVFTATDTINCIAIVKHNFGSGDVQVTIQTLNVGGNPATPGDWTTQKAAFTPTDDTVIVLRMADTSCDGVRVFYEPVSTAPRASVLMIGEFLSLDKGIPPGHTPITMGRRTEKVGPRNQGGDILGKIVISSYLASSIQQRDLDPTWYRTYLEPFRLASDEGTHVFAWSPLTHPDEVAYCDVTNDPIPVINQKTGTIDITFEIQGIC